MLLSTCFFGGELKLFSVVVAFKPEYYIYLYSKPSLEHSEDGISRDFRFHLSYAVMITPDSKHCSTE